MTTPNNRAAEIRAALEAAQQPDYGDEWHREHAGALRDVTGYEWWCGDDYCDCTQARVTAWFWNTSDVGRRLKTVIPVGLWEGEFHTDGEPGAVAELTALRQELTDAAPDLAAQIVWSVLA